MSRLDPPSTHPRGRRRAVLRAATHPGSPLAACRAGLRRRDTRRAVRRLYCLRPGLTPLDGNTMGRASHHLPVLPLVVAFSQHADARDWARDQVETRWGPVALVSPRFEFSETDYYAPSMGQGLELEIWALERLMAPEELPERKIQTNAWEVAYAQRGDAGAERTAASVAPAGQAGEPAAVRRAMNGAGTGVPRPLNLDPGYLTLAKLVLASTKDHSHRLYLGEGIYAEVTLNYVSGRWQPLPWTYPNYRRDDYQRFLDRCRQQYAERLREERGR